MKKTMSLLLHVVSFVCIIGVFAFWALAAIASTVENIDSSSSFYELLSITDSETFGAGVVILVLTIIAALLLVATAVLVVLNKKKKAPVSNALSIVTGLLLLVVGILMFCVMELYIGQVFATEAGSTGNSGLDDLIGNIGDAVGDAAKDAFRETNGLGVGAILSGICALVAGVLEIGNGVLTFKK